MKYYYSGTTRQKEPVQGTLEAQDEIEARLKLRAMQIRPSQLSPFRISQFSLENLKYLQLTSPVNTKDLVVFTRQFSSLIDAGVPVVQCLAILAEQEKRTGFKVVLEKIKSDIEAGSGLADALGKFPKIFSEFYVRIVEAGEVSGTLDNSLKRIAAQLEKLDKLRSKVISALTYPMLTLVTAVVTLIFLLIKVVPKIAELYQQGNAKLPEITQTVLAISDWFQRNYYIVMTALGSFVVLVIFLSKWKPFREVWDPIVVHIPLFGTLIQKSSIAKLSRTLSTLISSGVPLLSAFDICKKLMTNLAVKASIERAHRAVAEGKTVSQGLSGSRFYPPMVIHMINIGEMTGKLDDLLGKVADIYDTEVDDAINALTGMIQPVLIIGVGGIIAVLLLAMYLPIFQLADKMQSG